MLLSAVSSAQLCFVSCCECEHSLKLVSFDVCVLWFVSPIICVISCSLWPRSGNFALNVLTFWLKSSLLLHVRIYLSVSPIMRPLNVAVGWHDSLCKKWNVSVGFVCVLMSSIFSL